MKCEVCNDRDSIGVASVPGVPYSAGYCEQCLQANAHPYYIVVMNTACVGGLERSAEWWREGVVTPTLEWLNKSLDEFTKDVDTLLEKL